MNLIRILKSNYCRLVFLFSLIMVSLIIPKKIFYGFYFIIGISFIITTSLLITCFVRDVKEKIIIAKSRGMSLLGIIGTIIGLGALQSCTIGAPVCGASLGAGFLSLLFPGFLLKFLEKYSILIILFSLLIQIIALYFMRCFKK